MDTFSSPELGSPAHRRPPTDAKAAPRRHGAKVRFPPPLVFVCLFGAGVALQRWATPFAVPLPPWPRILGGAVIALAGSMSVIAARVLFVRTGQNPAPWTPSPELLVKGIYIYTRNPMYLGVTLLQLGLGIALGNGWIAALAPLALLVVHVIAVRPEETYLTEKFGESYLRYKTAVRRYL
ncbi:MAG TPA: isoprenylcysteine carboxylmethyltransferase family protein [Polyangiaceae bacterium]|jgi:protein-S-isoprenylcysteine O-methyltransferase Ste14|nr:isoprenylcysteine carboxylmethyltransferase family protein [Polyangiaceae bacterium]